MKVESHNGHTHLSKLV